MKAIFFTDVDGTLLDHYSYSYEKSLIGMSLLENRSIPLIAVSSKTFDEMSILTRELHLEYPFAFENGSGIAYPSEKNGNFNLELYGPGVENMVKFLPEIEKLSGKKLTGIPSLTENEIVELTGLNFNSATLAKKRKTTLPFIAEGVTLLSNSEITGLNVLLKDYNFYITKGGRFNHLIPADSGKGEAVKKIIEFYRNKFKDEILTAAAGDSLNDIPMLESVDHPYVIRKPGGGFIDFTPGKIMNSEGPSGFSEAVEDFLNIIAG